MRQAGKRLAVTNGCFDLLHTGHVLYLQDARAEADVLLVGLNGDASVRELKGPSRPINPALDQAALLAALGFVDGVCVFEDKRATQFLQLAQPDVYVKGGDYTLETLMLMNGARWNGRWPHLPDVAGARAIHHHAG